jgi:thymidylate synthase ThyX
MFSARVLCDSVSPNGSRLTTVEMVYARITHSEHVRHRAFSFNVASSRAIPISKVLREVISNPFVPIHWGANQKGMQAHFELTGFRRWACRTLWLQMRWAVVAVVWLMSKLGVHKQIANRLCEPYAWCTVICTGNDRAWRHFFALRCHPMAEPHIRLIAEMTRDAIFDSKTTVLKDGEMHRPLFGVPGDELITDDLEKMKISAGRCARTSYLTHMGLRDTQADIALCDKLIGDLHFSPTEHVAVASSSGGNGGNFGAGWDQYRKSLPGEFTA